MLTAKIFYFFLCRNLEIHSNSTLTIGQHHKMNPKNICFNSFLNILHKCVRHIHSHAMLHSCCFFFFYWFIFFLSCRSRLVFCMVEQALRVNAPICALYACVHIYMFVCVNECERQSRSDSVCLCVLTSVPFLPLSSCICSMCVSARLI